MTVFEEAVEAAGADAVELRADSGRPWPSSWWQTGAGLGEDFFAFCRCSLARL